MNVAGLEKLMTLGLLAAFLLPAVSLGADRDSPPAAVDSEFDLQLEDALSQLGDEYRIGGSDDEVPVLAERHEPIQVAALSNEAVREMWTSARTVSEQRSSGASTGKKRWWKTKKFWISVGVAAVVGAALSGGDGDDTVDDGED